MHRSKGNKSFFLYFLPGGDAQTVPRKQGFQLLWKTNIFNMSWNSVVRGQIFSASCLNSLIPPSNFFVEGSPSWSNFSSSSSSFTNRWYGPVVSFIHCFFFTAGAVTVVFGCLSQPQSSGSTELWLSRHRPSTRTLMENGFHCGRQSTLLSGSMPVCQGHFHVWVSSPRLWDVTAILGTSPNPFTHPATQESVSSRHISVPPDLKVVFSDTRVTPDSTDYIRFYRVNYQY